MTWRPDIIMQYDGMENIACNIMIERGDVVNLNNRTLLHLVVVPWAKLQSQCCHSGIGFMHDLLCLEKKTRNFYTKDLTNNIIVLYIHDTERTVS